MMRRFNSPCFAAELLLVGIFGAGAATGQAPPSWQLVHEGVAVELDVAALESGAGRSATAPELREGVGVGFRFTITDAASGQAISGLYPAAWMDRLLPGETASMEACVEKVEEFVSGSLLRQAELDLNVYYVVALNDDATLTVVDPLFGFGGTKLLAMIDLPGPGEDWVLTRDTSAIFVSLPESGQVAEIDAAAWTVRRLIDVGPRPGRLRLDGDDAFLWVALDPAAPEEGKHASGLAFVDLRTLDGEHRRVEHLPLAGGPHELAFSDDGRFAFVTGRAAGRLWLLDAARRRLLGEVATGPEPSAVAFSDLAGAAYVAHAGDGSVAVVRPETAGPRVTARLRTAPGPAGAGAGLEVLRFAPEGRLAFALNPRTDRLYVIDAARGQVVQSGEMEDGPDQVAFSDQLAFIHHRGSEIVLMVPLDEVGPRKEGQPIPVVDFPGGQKAFGEGRRPSRAPAIVQAPGASAVLVANPADEMIYFYKEGMAAPMGGFKNYGRQPRAVLVVDRSLKERRTPGVYETAAMPRRPGRYEVAFFLDSPRIVHCFTAEVAPDPVREAERRQDLPLRVEPLFAKDRPVGRGENLPLRFRLLDPASGEAVQGLDDVQVMAWTSGNWQRRQPAREVEAGVYEAAFVLPEPGSYHVAVECPSRRLAFHQSPPLLLEVRPP